MKKLAASLNADDADRLLDKHGLAERMNVSTRSIDSYMRAGRLPFFKVGKTVRFRWSDVLEKLSDCRVN